MILKLLVGLGVVTVATCGVTFAAETKMLEMNEVLLVESEPGISPFTTRLLVNQSLLRLDDGDDQGDYVLFQRNGERIYSVNHGDRSILVIDPPKSEHKVGAPAFTVESRELDGAPDIAGKPALEHTLRADGEVCQTIVSVEGLLPEARQALIEYNSILNRQGWAGLATLPEAFKTPCYLATDLFHWDAFLSYGFPIQYYDYKGVRRSLTGYQQVRKSSELFQLPAHYRQYKPGDTGIN